MLVDSHCHLDKLDLSKYENDLAKALAAANRVNVKFFLCPGVTLIGFPSILQLAKQNENVVVAIGLHPTEDLMHEPTVQELCTLADDKLIVGIGETGLDYYYCRDDKNIQEQQQRVFRTHIQAAKELKKPLIIHSRLAEQDIIRILKEEKASDIGGVFHCYTENWEMAQTVLNMNFYISFSGIVTFKNAEMLRDVAKKVPLDKMLLETDAPFLAPTPYRGKPNEPAYLPLVAECIAKNRADTLDNIAKHSSENFFNLFFAGINPI